MESIRVDIINPKVKKLLSNLADLNLIRIKKEETKSDFSILLKKQENIQKKFHLWMK